MSKRIAGYVPWSHWMPYANIVQFNLILNDAEEIYDLTSGWRQAKIEDGIPPPLTLEIYLDLTELTKSQSLVILDDQGKRWNVSDALSPAVHSNARPYTKRSDRVVLERWQFSLKDSDTARSRETDMLSNVYKRCIPVFRTLVTLAKMLPANKYQRGVTKKSANNSSNHSLKLKFRILNQVASTSAADSLGCALYPGQPDIVDTYNFGNLSCPVGELCASVTYRTNCEFRVDDSEAMLSSHFMAMDDKYFRPSLGRNDSSPIAGSAPTSKQESLPSNTADQVYGSLSTFHTNGPKPSSSPMSALRAVADAGSGSNDSIPQKSLPIHRNQLEQRTASREGFARRPSVSFQPFKAGSVAGSPASGMMQPPLSPASASGRSSNPLLQHRRGPSLTTLPQAILRTPNYHNEGVVASSTSSSPKPAPINRYSSSFSHRRSRFSSGASKEGGSSGKPSPSSSAQPESDVLNKSGEQNSSGSVQKSDDENVKDFLQLLESGRDLKSFSRNDAASQNASMRRTTAALAKYQQMSRDLSDSISSSLLKGSSSSSSRQLHNVPQMVGASVSTGSSPGKPLSPHTPHTPAVPSRLSAVDYGEPIRSRSRPRNASRTTSRDDRDDQSSDGTSTAIPIPSNFVSPRPWTYGQRSSSASQRQIHSRIEDDEEPAFSALRSASLPAGEDRSIDLNSLRLSEEAPSSADQSTRKPPTQTRLQPTESSSRSDDEKIQTAESPAISPGEELPAYPFPAPSTSLRRNPESATYTHNRSRGSRGSLNGPTSSLNAARRGSPLYLTGDSPSSSSGAAGSIRGAFGVRNSPGSRGSIGPAGQEDDEYGGIFTMSELGGRQSLEEAKREGSLRRGGRGHSASRD